MNKEFKNEYADYYRLNAVTLEEVCQGHTPGFLFFATECDPSVFVGGVYPWHWHSYVQFFYVLEGELIYTTHGGTFHFHPGEAGFINANVPHMLTVKTGRETRYIEYLFYPSMIGGSHHGNIMQKYVQPITENTGLEILLFQKNMPGQEEIAGLLKEVYSLFYGKANCYELLIQAKLSILWARMFEFSREYRKNLQVMPTSERLKTMLLYINEHFAEKITLEQIAEAGTCSCRECSRTFQNDLHTTPFQYLREIRVNKAAHMLINTNESVTFISEACGFSDPGHFSKIFKKQSGMTPKDFRFNAHKQRNGNGS